MWVLSPGLCWPVVSLRQGGVWGAVCVGDMGAAGVWRETVLPGWLVVLGCVLVVVGVSTRKGAGGASLLSWVCCGMVPVLGGIWW